MILIVGRIKDEVSIVFHRLDVKGDRGAATLFAGAHLEPTLHVDGVERDRNRKNVADSGQKLASSGDEVADLQARRGDDECRHSHFRLPSRSNNAHRR